MSSFYLLPAVDVKDGRAVRLVQGEITQESIYGAPLEVALDFQSRALATGCRRVNLGTAALENPEWTARVIQEHGDRIAVGLDVRGHTLAARGWTQEGGDLFETIARLERDGCSRYVVTDVAKDGTLMGPNLELLKSVCAVTHKPVIASGGIATLEDISALAQLQSIGVEGAIVGKALYAGAFTLEQALQTISSAN